MKVIFMGTPDFAAETLQALLASRHEVVLAVTQPDRAKGRSKELQPPPVKEIALKAGIPVFQPEKLRAPETLAELKKYPADAAVVAAYGKIIPKDILKLPEYGCINVHASLLPKYRGAAPIQWAVLNGEKTSGVTIMQMNEGLDTGDMIAQREIELEPKETGDSLFEKLARIGAELLVETLDKIEQGEVRPAAQPEESPTPYARMITKADGRIDWNRDAASIERLVRGMNSWPGAYSFLDGRNVKIWACDVQTDGNEGYTERIAKTGENTAQTAAPGTLLQADQTNGIVVQTGSGALQIRELQLAGKKRMSGAEFLRGCRWTAGMRFE